MFISAVEFGPAGDILALAVSDGQIGVYNLEGELLYAWRAHQGEIALAFSQDGRLLATSSRDGFVKLWRTSECFVIMEKGDLRCNYFVKSVCVG